MKFDQKKSNAYERLRTYHPEPFQRSNQLAVDTLDQMAWLCDIYGIPEETAIQVMKHAEKLYQVEFEHADKLYEKFKKEREMEE